MIKKIRVSIISIALTVITTASPAFAQEPELPAESQKDFVSAVLPYALDFVHDHISAEFDSDERSFYEDYNGAIYRLPGKARKISDLGEDEYKKFIEFPIVRADKFYVFYGAYKNVQQALQEVTPYTVARSNNPALQRYATIPPSERRNDLYLWSPDTPYWYSEYTIDGVHIPFRSYFIVHLNAVDDSHTRVEVIEDKPVVNMGNKMSVDANGVVHHFEVKDVAPTTRDREFILSCINQFIERKVPGRHWFNCKDNL